MAWNPDGSQIATGVAGNAITLRDANSGQEIRKFQGHTTRVKSLTWSPDGKRLASGDDSGVIKIWDTSQDQMERVIAEDAEHGGVAFSPDDRSVAYWAVGQTTKIRDAVTGKQIHSLPGPAGAGLVPVWSPDGKHLACGGDDGSIVVYDTKTGEEARNWQHEGVKAPVSTDTFRSVSVSWHPDSRQLASVSEKDAIVRIWDAATGSELDSFDTGRRRVRVHLAVAWSPDGERLATGGFGRIEIWDRVGWRNLHTIAATGRSFTWSHDGRYLAAAGENSAIAVWDTLTGRATQTFKAHTGMAQIAGWSEDGRRIATCAQDGVRIWNPKTGREFFSLYDAKAMSWSHDRKRIATVFAGKVRIHDASIGYELAAELSKIDNTQSKPEESPSK